MNNNKIQKCQNPTAASVCRVLLMLPAHSATQGAGRPPKPPLQPHPLIPPILTPFKAGASKGTCFWYSLPCAAGVPIKPCLNSSSDLINFCWQKSPRTQVDNPPPPLNFPVILQGRGVNEDVTERARTLVVSHTPLPGIWWEDLESPEGPGGPAFWCDRDPT